MPENLGSAILRLSTDSSKLNKGIDSAEKRTANLKKAFKIGGLAALGMGVAFAKVAKDAINTADNFAKMSKKTGISVESLSALEFAAKLSGGSLELMSTGLNRLAANAVDSAGGTGLAKEAFDFLKISVLGAAGEIKPMETLLLEVADKFALMEDGTLKTGLAMKIFGKSGTELIPTLNEGSAGLQKMRERAEELGIIISTKTAQQSERFNDALLELSSAFQGIIFAILDSGLLQVIVDLAETMADASANSSVFTTAGNALAGVMKIIQIAALKLQLGFNLLVRDLLNLVQSTNKILGVFSPFKSITDDLTSSIDKYNLKITQGKGKIDDIRKGTTKLTKEVKKADTATKKQTKSLGALSKAAKDATAKEKKLVDELKDYVKQAREAIAPTGDVTTKYEALKDAGFDLKEIMFTLGGEIDSAVEALEEMGKEIPDELALLVDLERDANLASGALTSLISAENGLAKLSLKKPLEDYNQALKDITTEAGTTAAAVKTKFDESTASITSSSSTFTTELGNNFSSLLDGIDNDLIPGIDKIKGAFDAVMSTVTGIMNSVNSILGFFGKDGIGGINLGGLFGGSGGGGTSGGGIFGGLSSFNPIGAIASGVGGLLGGILGSSKGSQKETAFNTRLTLGWIEGHFPVFNQLMIAGVDTTQLAVNRLINLETWAQFQGGKLALIVTRMDSLLGISNNIIAAIKGIPRHVGIKEAEADVLEGDDTSGGMMPDPLGKGVFGFGPGSLLFRSVSEAISPLKLLLQDVIGNGAGSFLFKSVSAGVAPHEVVGFLDGIRGALGISDLGVTDDALRDFIGLPTAMAHGGIVTKPTLSLVGEAGPEAVIPLDRLQRIAPTTITFSPTIHITVNEREGGSASGRLAKQLGDEIIKTVARAIDTNQGGLRTKLKKI